MRSGLHVPCYGINIQTVSPVLFKISIQNNCVFFSAVHYDPCNRCRLFDRLSILHCDSCTCNVKADLISLMSCRPAIPKNIADITLRLRIRLKSFQFRSGIPILIPDGILISIGCNRFRQFSIRKSFLLFLVNLLIDPLKEIRNHLCNKSVPFIIGMQIIRCDLTSLNSSVFNFGPDSGFHTHHGKLIGFCYFQMHFLRIQTVVIFHIIHEEYCRFAAISVAFPDQTLVGLLKEFRIFIIDGKFNEHKIRLILQ